MMEDANYMHICYENVAHARKALEKDGKLLRTKLMIGVKPFVEEEVLHEQLSESLEAELVSDDYTQQAGSNEHFHMDKEWEGVTVNEEEESEDDVSSYYFNTSSSESDLSEAEDSNTYRTCMAECHPAGQIEEEGLSTPSPQHFGHQVTGVEAVDNRLGKIEKENASKFTINHTNVKKKMESYDESKFDRVCQPANTCDVNMEMENDTSAIITSVQSEENVEGVVAIGGRSSKMEDSDEVTMTAEEGEVVCQKRGNWISKLVEKEDTDSLDHETCNDVYVWNDQNDASQAKGQGQQELCKDTSLFAMTANEYKEEEDGGISERKTRELSSKDKKSEKQPSNLCADNLLGRKSSDSTRSSLESSRGQHKKNQVTHECEVCGYSTIHTSHLNEHMSVHTQERPYVCEICNKRFKLTRHLHVHKTLHSDDKQFLCENCGRRFSQKTHLDSHLPSHMDEKRFKCKTCGVEFRHKSSLHEHEKTQHYKNPPVFPCNYCQYSSKRKHDTKTHEILKHTKNYPHYCSLCDWGFLTSGVFKKHMSKHTKQK